MDVDRLEHRADEIPLFVCELRSPYIKQENDAGPIAAIPGFVLDRVVEDPGLAFDGAACVVADTKAA